MPSFAHAEFSSLPPLDIARAKAQAADKSMPLTRDAIEQRGLESSVLTRRQPAYDPQNIHFGSWILIPSVTNSAAYSDNVYARNNNKQGDISFAVRPELKFKSDLLVHEFGGDVYYEQGVYKKLSKENYHDYGLGVGGQYVFYHGLSMPVSLGYAQSHARRDDPEDRLSPDPTVFHVFKGQAGFDATGNYLEADLKSSVENFDFDDTTSFAGTTIDNSDRNRATWKNTGTLGMARTSVFAPYFYLEHTLTSYEKKVSDTGIARDSTDLEGGIGSFIGFSKVSSSNFRIGSVRREFDDDTLSPISAFTYLLNLNWEPSTLAAFSLTGQRSIRETSLDAAAQIESSLLLSMVYELNPNILLKPALGYIERDYKDLSDYKTESYTGALDVTYKVNPHVWTVLNYTGIMENAHGRDTGIISDGYDENRILLLLKLQM